MHNSNGKDYKSIINKYIFLKHLEHSYFVIRIFVNLYFGIILRFWRYILERLKNVFLIKVIHISQVPASKCFAYFHVFRVCIR